LYALERRYTGLETHNGALTGRLPREDEANEQSEE
jgi:hypothetical protein